MRKFAPWAAAGCWMLLAGCASDPYKRYQLGPARPVVGRCVDMMGGLRRWQWAGPIRAKALVTIYDAAGKATVHEVDQVIDVNAGTIRATSVLPEGTWTAEIDQEGKSQFQAKGFTATEDLSSQVISALWTNLHRVRGPLNLLGRDEQVVDAAPARLPGADLVRVPVRGGGQGIVAYYFDVQTSVLRFVTSGADAPGRDGTVTKYLYRVAPNGMAFPSKIAVVKIGQHVLVGEEPVLEIEYRQVRF